MCKQYTDQKGFCDDLDEGKMSLPMMFTFEASQITRKIMQLHARSHESMAYRTKLLILEEMNNCKSLERTKAVMESIQDAVYLEIERYERDSGVRNPVIKMVADMLKI